MLDFRTCKFSELLALYTDLGQVKNKTVKQINLRKLVKRYLFDRFRNHFDIYQFSGQIMDDSIPDNKLHNKALACFIKARMECIGQQTIYVDYSKPVGERCRYVDEYGINAVTDEEIAFEQAISKDYH